MSRPLAAFLAAFILLPACSGPPPQKVMDQEILYAAAGGIDYWIFHMYILRNEQGNLIVDETGWRVEDSNLSRRYYLSSQYKHLVKFTLMLGVLGYQDSNFGEYNWDFQVEKAMTQFYKPYLGDLP